MLTALIQNIGFIFSTWPPLGQTRDKEEYYGIRPDETIASSPFQSVMRDLNAGVHCVYSYSGQLSCYVNTDPLRAQP